MRKFVEPTMRNLLKQRLVAGVSPSGLIALTGTIAIIQILAGSSPLGNQASVAVMVVGYVSLRIIAFRAKLGWEESLIYAIEKQIASRKEKSGSLSLVPANEQTKSPDTLDERGMIAAKSGLLEQLLLLQNKQSLSFLLARNSAGAEISLVSATSGKDEGERILRNLITTKGCVYSLYQLPYTTSPLWLSEQLAQIEGPLWLIVNYRGLNPHEIKARIERARRLNSRTGTLTHIDSEVAFDEASSVLQGLSQGSDKVLGCSVVIITESEASLDPSLFCKEKDPALTIYSTLGIRKRPHRSLNVRAVSACDLYPSFLDSIERGASVMKTFRGNPLYFDPQDSRLESLHWLVCGATGSGKSFFTGLVLKRMLDLKVPMSILFVDHNRSFRRFVRNHDGPFLEPQSLTELGSDLKKAFLRIHNELEVAGIELADLPLSDKKEASRLLLSGFEKFLRSRTTTHPVYLVLDECWNFMRDEPLLVQRAFREFRKLNGAAIAITQSLGDFLSDDSGKAIFQNAPIRILLRQGEDPAIYRGLLSLNDVEIEKLRFLKQQKGQYSECLIKTPYSSQLGRLFPSDEEHSILRTDNLREEMVREAKLLNQKEVSCV